MTKDKLKYLQDLPVFILVTTGRTGSDLLQSLLDTHPQVLTFNGSLYQFNEFWFNSKCLKSNSVLPIDLINEFIGINIDKFKSKYDTHERKHELGINRDSSLDIDLDIFKEEFCNIITGKIMSYSNILLSIYGAYAKTLNQEIFQKRIFFHHIHQIEQIPDFISYFPNCKIICTTRDPRSNFISGILNHRNFNETKFNQEFLNYYIRRILIDVSFLKNFKNEYIAIKLENMRDFSTLNALCNWLNIDYNVCMNSSTWGGLLWHGDSLSKYKINDDGDIVIHRYDWNKILPIKDKIIFNFLFYKRLLHYEYSSKKPTFLSYLLVFLLIPLPLKFEMEIWNFSKSLQIFKRNSFKYFLKIIASNIYNYSIRIFLFYKFFFSIHNFKSTDYPYLK